MNFVFKKESIEVDSWLANMDEAEMERSIGEAARALKVWSRIFVIFVPYHYRCLSCYRGKTRNLKYQIS